MNKSYIVINKLFLVKSNAIYTILLLFIYTISSAQSGNTNYAYVRAPNGLNIRTTPSIEGAKIGTLNYNAKVKIIKRTSVPLTLMDNGKKIVGNWVEIQFSALGSPEVSGYVFDGFLTDQPGIKIKSQKGLSDKNATVSNAFINYILNVLRSVNLDDVRRYQYKYKYNIRNVYQYLISLTTLNEFSALLRYPLFVSKVENTTQINLNNQNDFGHYNPKTILWLKIQLQAFLKKSDNVRTTTPMVENLFKKQLFSFWMVHQYLNKYPDEKQKILEDYQSKIKNGNLPYNYYDIHPMDYNFYKEIRTFQMLKDKEIRTAVFYWLRRTIDKTEKHFFDISDLFITTYYPELRSELKQRIQMDKYTVLKQKHFENDSNTSLNESGLKIIESEYKTGGGTAVNDEHQFEKSRSLYENCSEAQAFKIFIDKLGWDSLNLNYFYWGLSDQSGAIESIEWEPILSNAWEEQFIISRNIKTKEITNINYYYRGEGGGFSSSMVKKSANKWEYSEDSFAD